MNLYNELVKYKVIIDGFNHDYLDKTVSTKYTYFEKIFNNEYNGYASAFKLKDCLFYINNELRCNAFARRLKGYNIISISCSYVITIEKIFDSNIYNNTFLDLSKNIITSKAHNELLELPKFNLSQFILNSSIHFTFGHEFRHILQFNTENKDKEYSLNENINSSKFKLQKHVWEYDADRYGAFHVLKYIFNIKNEFNITDEEQLKYLVYTGISNIIITQILFYFGLENVHGQQEIQKNNFYTKEKSHPHPIVRIMYILDFYFNNLENSFPKLLISEHELHNNSLMIAKEYLKTIIPEKYLVEIFLTDLSETKEVVNYCDFLYESAIKDKTIKYMWETNGVHFWRN